MTQISRILNGLQPNANYTVQVRSKNSDGQYSDWSNTYSFNTPSTALVVNQNSVQQILSGNGLIQTGSADPRVVISSKGIAATNSSGGYTFVLDAVLGAASFTGNITAQSGTIGGMNIIGASLTSGSGTSAMGISGSGQYSFWAGNVDPVAAPFSVQRDGTIKATGLTATNSVVVGSGPAGNYAGITPNSPYPYAIWAGADTASGANSKFYVTNSGSLVAQSGSFVNSIFSGTSTNSGSIIGGAILVPNSSNPTFKVDSSGNMTASNAYLSGSITSNSGNIGGWTIAPNILYSNYGSGSFAAMSPGTLSGASANYVFWAGNSNPASAPFSVKADGTVVATGIIATASLVVGQSGGKYTGIIPANGIAIFGGASDNIGTGATFAVTNSGSLYATIGTIGGWNITPNELYIGSGTQKLALNTSASPKIYVGNGVFSDAGTGFFVDNKGNFSLGNQLTFVPSQGSASTVKTTASVTFGSNTIVPVYDNTSQVIINGTLVTGSALPTGTYVTNVTYGVNPTITLNNNATATDASSSVTFQPDNLSLLNVVGRIRGIVDSVSPISAPTLYATITSASINTTASVISFTTNGHFFSASSILILENLPTTNGLSKFNYAASVGNAYVIASVPNSINFTINTGSVTGLTSGNITSLSGKASIQQLTMGLHVAENPGTSYAHQAGTGVRLDEYNWWFTNNQFRVGNPLSYMQYTASGLKITGGDKFSTVFQVGPTAANNLIAIYQPTVTTTVTTNPTTNYTDIYFNTYTASGTTTLTVANTPTFSSSTTSFYVDGSGQFSLGSKFQYSGSAGTLIIGDQTGGTVGFQAPSNPTPTSIALYAGTGTVNAASAPFRVNYQGDLFASSASITGNITASAGSIGGWVIAPNNLYSSSGANYYGMYLGTGNNIFFAGATDSFGTNGKFIVNSDGGLYATSASVSGKITATSGNIGGWTASSNSLTSANVGMYAPTSPASSEIAFFAGSAVANRASAPFRVDYSGNLYALSGSITGTINAQSGSIGSWTVNSNQIYSTSGSAGTYLFTQTVPSSGNSAIAFETSYGARPTTATSYAYSRSGLYNDSGTISPYSWYGIYPNKNGTASEQNLRIYARTPNNASNLNVRGNPSIQLDGPDGKVSGWLTSFFNGQINLDSASGNSQVSITESSVSLTSANGTSISSGGLTYIYGNGCTIENNSSTSDIKIGNDGITRFVYLGWGTSTALSATINSSAIYYTYNANYSANMFIGSNGSIYRGTSSFKFKDKISPISNYSKLSNKIPSNKIINSSSTNIYDSLKIVPVEYDGEVKDGPTMPSMGFIAEDVAEKNPRLAVFDEEENVINYNTNGMLAILWAVVQEQQIKIEELSSSVSMLVNKIT